MPEAVQQKYDPRRSAAMAIREAVRRVQARDYEGSRDCLAAARCELLRAGQSVIEIDALSLRLLGDNALSKLAQKRAQRDYAACTDLAKEALAQYAALLCRTHNMCRSW